MAMVEGLDMARENRFITVPEAAFMVPNPNGIPYFRSDVGSDGNGLTLPQNWVEHLSDGNTMAEGHALTGEDGVVSRDFSARYSLMERIWRNVSGLPTSDVAINAGLQRQITWNDVENGSPAIETETGYYGANTSAMQLVGGKIRAFNIDVTRSSDGGSVSGSIEYHFNRAFPDVSIPGAQAHNARVYIEAINPVADLVLGVKVGAGAAAPVTLEADMDAAAIKAAFEAHADIVTAVVTGTIEDGDLTVEITSPASTKIVITKTSGARWAIAQRAYGGDGTGLVYNVGPYLEPNHARVYLALDDDDLASIDFFDRPDQYGQGGDPHLLKTSTSSGFAMDDLWKGHYSQTGKAFATQFVGGARNCTMSLSVPNSMKAGSDCRFLIETEKGCMATGFWLVRDFECGGWGYREQVFVGRNDAAGFGSDNDVYMRTFPLKRVRNPEGTGSLKIIVTTPAP